MKLTRIIALVLVLGLALSALLPLVIGGALSVQGEVLENRGDFFLYAVLFVSVAVLLGLLFYVLRRGRK